MQRRQNNFWSWHGLVLVTLTLAFTACTLPTEAPSGGDTNGAVIQTGSGTPTVVITSPADGSQAVVGRAVRIQIRGEDSVGLQRLEMRETGRVVATQSIPVDSDNKTALVALSYIPAFAGTVQLEVVAYRAGGVVSDPARISLQIVGSVNELDNPNGLDPTLGVAAGAVCSGQVNTDQLNLRGGPGTTFDRVVRLPLGEVLNVIGRNADSTWYQVKRAAGTLGWVSAQFLTTTGDCSRAPVVS